MQSCGVILAGFAVNFDGLRRVQENRAVLHYLNPAGATAVTPDISSILKTAADSRLAQQFVRFYLSEEGQATWSATAKSQNGLNQTLYHYPIKPSLYESHKGKLAVEDNPFETNFGIQINQAVAVKQSESLVPLVAAICNENYILLQQTWAAIRAFGMNESALAKLCEPIIGEQEAFDAVKKLQDADESQASPLHQEWSDAFRKQLKEVIALAKGSG